MNDPPTAVGGIRSFYLYRFGRLSMNDPPPAVGGIQIIQGTFGQSLRLREVRVGGKRKRE